MSSSEKSSLTVLPVPSTSFTTDAVFEHPGGDAVLGFEFVRNGIAYVGGLRFAKVRAYRFRTEGHCTVWHIDGVYDTLAEVSESKWVRELLGAQPPEMRDQWEIHHFMIYVDSSGCYEIAAESWSWLDEKRLP